LFVVLWLEEDHLGTEDERKVAFATVTDLIEAKLSWLRTRVLVRGLKISHRLGEHAPLSEVSVTNLSTATPRATPPGAAPRR
jgi:hypothetical protein